MNNTMHNPKWWHTSAIAREIGSTEERVTRDILMGVYRSPDRIGNDWYVRGEEVMRVFFASSEPERYSARRQWGELTVSEVAELLRTSHSNVRRMIHEGAFQSARMEGRAWRISAFETAWLLRHAERYATMPEAAAILGVAQVTVVSMVSRGVFKDVRCKPLIRVGERLQRVVRRSELVGYRRGREAHELALRLAKLRAEEARLLSAFVVPRGYVSAPEAVRMLGVSRERVRQLCECGKLGDAHREGRRWLIRKSAIKKLKRAMNLRRRAKAA